MKWLLLLILLVVIVMPKTSEAVVTPTRKTVGAERGKPWYERANRHKRALLHESEGARHKLPGHRRPSRSKWGKYVRGKLGVFGNPNPPVPPTSQPPYVLAPHRDPNHRPPGWEPWFDPGKEPIP